MKKLDVKFFENFNDNIDLKRVLSVEVSQLNKNLNILNEMVEEIKTVNEKINKD